MKLTLLNGDLTLPDDFGFEIERNNPFFSDDGTSSLPVEIPATIPNLSLLGFPNRIGLGRRFQKSHKAILQHGAHQVAGSLVIDSASSEASMTGVLATEESDFYTNCQDLSLKDCVRGQVVLFPITKVPQLSLASNGEPGIIHHLWDLYSGLENIDERLDGFTIFPVYTSDGYDPCILNSPSGYATSETTIKDGNGEVVHVPARYGTTPFIYLWKLIEIVLECCGYEIAYDVFSDPDRMFSHIVVLNRCADALVASEEYVRLEDLVPSISVGELITWLHDKFGAGIFVKGRKVNIVLLQDSINSHPDIDLTECVNGDISVTFPSENRITLDCDKSIDGAEPPCDTLQALAERYPLPQETLQYSESDGFYFNKPTGEYYRIMNGTRAVFGSNAFRYDRENFAAAEDISSKDAFVPMVIHEGKLMPNIGQRIHLNSSVNGTEEETDQPILICWAGTEDGHRIGTTQGINIDGTDIASLPLPPLTPEGLYPYCWSAYNELLLNQAPTLKAHLDMSRLQSSIFNLDLSRPKYLRGQKVLISSFAYKVSNTGIRCGECTLQMLPNYSDWIEDSTPSPGQVLYDWEYRNTIEAALRRISCIRILEYTADVPLYTAADVPAYAPSRIGIKAKTRKNKMRAECLIGGTGGSYLVTRTVEFEEYFISIETT